MNRILKRSIGITTATLMVLGIFANTSSVLAEEYTAQNSLTSLIQAGPGGTSTYVSPEKVVRDTYWADLEGNPITIKFVVKRPKPSSPPKVPYVEQREYKDITYNAVFPKYILKPTESAYKDADKLYYGEKTPSFIPSTGITDSPEGIDTMGKAPYGPNRFYFFGYRVGKDAENPYSYYGSRGMNSSDPIDDAQDNPFGFKESDVLSQDEIKDPTRLTVYGDIKAENSSDSKKVGEYKVGDELKLDFSADASWFKRFMQGYILSQTRNTSVETSDWAYNSAKVGYDSQIVYTLDIPKEVDIVSPSVAISGIDGFEATTEVDRVNGINKLVIRLRLKNDLRAKEELWKDFIAKLKNLDTSDVKLAIRGLYVNSQAQVGTKVNLRGTLGGYFEWLHSWLRIYPIPALPPGVPIDYDYYKDVETNYNYLYFVGKQSDSGRDQAAPTEKPNLISYTFKVKETPQNPSRPNPGRIDGRDRIETAIKISKKNYDRAKTVIVVRHDLFPDSMTASVLAKLKDAPILLNPTAKLDSRVGDEIKRLGAEEVIIAGGQNSVSEKVREDLKVYDADKNVERIAGADRYGTSEMVAKRVVGITGKKNTGVVASGQVFPDALSVGTFASRDGYPILLVKKDLVPSQIERAIKDLEINKTYIAGGTNTISKSTEAKLPGVLERMAGPTRYDTSVAIAKSKFGTSKEAYIASGEEFADALVISPISGKYNRPTLLASRNKNSNSPVRTYIRNAGFTSITAIGGERFVPYSVLEYLVK